MSQRPGDQPENLPPGLHMHPEVAAVNAEIHARPVEAFAAPARLRRIGFAYSDVRAGGGDLLPRFLDWCARESVTLDQIGERNAVFRHAGLSVTVELHTEFVSVTWRSAITDDRAYPPECGLEVFAHLGILLRCRVDVTDQRELPPGALAGFDPVSMCYAAVDGGRAQLATDFHPDRDGFIRYELATGGNSDLRRGALLRRLLEIETYRVVAMLGLPLARRIGPTLDSMEAELAHVLAEVADNATIDDHQQTLKRLNAISERAERQSAETKYRFAASAAYGEILNRRIGRLGEEAIGDYTTLARFLSNRVDPALATCAAMEKRQGAILAQAARATRLLGTRIELDVQIQNKALLDTISETTRNQYRLQTTVEGISTIALSYYLLGILSYVLAPVHFPEGLSKTAVLAVLAPLVIGLVYLGVRQLRKLHR